MQRPLQELMVAEDLMQTQKLGEWLLLLLLLLGCATLRLRRLQ